MLELDDQGHLDLLSDEPSDTIDVCSSCNESSDESEWMEDENDEMRKAVKKATGKDPPANFLLSGGCEHPSYDEMDYNCAFCGKTLTQKEDG